MRVRLGTVELSDHERRAIGRVVGAPDMATRKQIRDLIGCEFACLLAQWTVALNDETSPPLPFADEANP